jgi:hypothetical protein
MASAPEARSATPLQATGNTKPRRPLSVCSGPKSTVLCCEFCFGTDASQCQVLLGVLDEREPRESIVRARTAALLAALSHFRQSVTSKQSNRMRAGPDVEFVGTLAFVALTEAGTRAKRVRSFKRPRIAELAGFGLYQVALTGHHSAPAAPIFNALDLTIARTLLRFNGAVVRERIEAISDRAAKIKPCRALQATGSRRSRPLGG